MNISEIDNYFDLQEKMREEEKKLSKDDWIDIKSRHSQLMKLGWPEDLGWDVAIITVIKEIGWNDFSCTPCYDPEELMKSKDKYLLSHIVDLYLKEENADFPTAKIGKILSIIETMTEEEIDLLVTKIKGIGGGI